MGSLSMGSLSADAVAGKGVASRLRVVRLIGVIVGAYVVAVTLIAQLKDLTSSSVISITVSILLLAGLYTVMSLGLTVIYGVMKMVNLAHAGFLMLGAYATLVLKESVGVHPFLGLLIVFPLFFVIGIVIHWLMVRHVPTADVPTLQSLLLLFGLLLILQNIALSLFGGDNRSLLMPYTTRSLTFGPLDLRLSFVRVAVFAVALIAVVALQLFLNRTWTGRAIRAVAQNPTAARLVGADVGRIGQTSFGLGIAFAGLAGGLMANLFTISPFFGSPLMLRAFVIIVLGGLESFSGVAIGALVLAILESWSVIFFRASFQPVLAFSLLVVALVVSPQGLPSLLRRGRG